MAIIRIEPKLDASSGLYYEVTTDQDISSALTSLFNAAVTSVESHLSN